MLPYHLRPPSYGGKLKAKKKREATPLELDLPYRDGGPIQRAIQEDLLELRSMFFQTLPSDISCYGESFRIFKQAFAQAKTALLHTRTCPTKADRGAYQQLIYASCLNLLTKATSKKQIQFRDAVFAIFTLYTMYETCTLPKGPTAGLEMLMVDFQHEKSPRYTQRRAFHRKIRIDIESFSQLLCVRDVALSSVDANGPDPVTVVMARDVAVVIERLMVDNKLQPASYTGPMGLEGLAGHSTYPFPPSEKSFRAMWERNALNCTAMIGDGQETLPKWYQRPTIAWSYEIHNHLAEYLESRKAIRMPPQRSSKRNDRIRQSLLPIFQSKDESPLRQLDDAIHNRKHNTVEVEPRTVRFGETIEVPYVGPAPEVFVDVENDKGASTKPEESEKIKIALPDGISDDLKTSLEDAIRTLVERGEEFLPKSSNQSLSGKASVGDVSSLGRSRLSSVSGAGNQALAALLTRANEKPNNSGALFFETQGRISRRREGSDEDFSDLSDEDEVSIATASVGRLALEKLLGKAAQPRRKRRKRARGEGRGAKKAKVSEQAVGDLGNDEEFEAKSLQSLSSASSVGQGRAALENLLARVDGDT